MRLRDALGGTLALSILALAPGAAAQGSSPQAQFDHGLAEMLAGRYETGCPALASSQKADPRPGTLFTLGECELRWRHSASALRHLVAYLDDVVKLPSASDRELQADRVKLATTQRADLERLVGHVTLALPEGSPPDVVVRADGEPVERNQLAAPFAVDPGDHVFALVLADGRKSEQSVKVARGEQRRVALVLPSPPPTPAGTASPEPDATEATDATERTARSSSAGTWRTWVWISGGIGAAGVMLGGASAGVALAQKSSAASSCGTGGLQPGQCTSQQGVDTGSSARTWADVATVGFGVGAAGLATAIVLWLLSPSPGVTASAWHPAIGLGSDARWIGAIRTW
jgi:hypothetical protein